MTKKFSPPAKASPEASGQAPANAEEAARIETSLKLLLEVLPETANDAALVRSEVDRLKVPASRQWVSGRIATLLTQYFVGDAGGGISTAIADDWNHELAGCPAWALQRACRWWIGADNKDRRRRPLPGDISERVRMEMSVVRAAETALRRFDRRQADAVAGRGGAEAASRPDPTPEQKARVQRVVDRFLRQDHDEKRHEGGAHGAQ